MTLKKILASTAGSLVTITLWLAGYGEEPPRPAPAEPAVELAAAPDRRPPRIAPADAITIDIPLSDRQRNYHGGSCVHASMATLFRWQGQPEIADWWILNHRGGENWQGLSRALNASGYDYSQTTAGDVAFLEWAIRTRRGAAVTWGGGHMVCLVELDEKRAGLIDNNRVGRIIWQPRTQFIAEWRRRGGWAVTPVYNPPPMRPW